MQIRIICVHTSGDGTTVFDRRGEFGLDLFRCDFVVVEEVDVCDRLSFFALDRFRGGDEDLDFLSLPLDFFLLFFSCFLPFDRFF